MGTVFIKRAPAKGYHVAESHGVSPEVAEIVLVDGLDVFGKINVNAVGPQPIKVRLAQRARFLWFIPVTRWIQVTGFGWNTEDGTLEFRLNVA